MYSMKVIGAGSIGNHLAHAARKLEWNVDVYDCDTEALRRMKEEIYPQRYGSWDDKITLMNENLSNNYDIIHIGTPPETHIDLAIKSIKENPKAILIEKPYSNNSLENHDQLKRLIEKSNTKVFIGYDHIVGDSCNYFSQKISKLKLNDIEYIDVEIREHWQGILNAHPWIDGPENTYLGFSKRGGGACSEHSHGINMWQHIAHTVGAGKVKKIFSSMVFNKSNGMNYDKLCNLQIQTEKGVKGRLIQDVITSPPSKYAKIFTENSSYEWVCNYSEKGDAVIINEGGNRTVKIFEKKRPDDFINELNHITNCLTKNCESPISFNRGVDTQIVINAAFESVSKESVITIL